MNQPSKDHQSNGSSEDALSDIVSGAPKDSSKDGNCEDIALTADELVPGAIDSSSVKSSESSVAEDDDNGEDEDNFDVHGVPMPRLSSSTVPFSLEVIQPHHGHYGSSDPLFRGVCLYSTSSKNSSPEQDDRSSRDLPPQDSSTSAPPRTASQSKSSYSESWWLVPSIFQRLLQMRE